METIRKSLIRCKRCVNSLRRIDFIERKYGSEWQSPRSAEPEPEWERRVVTGIQPTGVLHVGNYFGAVRRCVRLQDQGEDLTVFIADLHSLTSTQEPAALRQRTLELTALLLASGIDPARSLVFAQSQVPRHAELCWALCCVGTQARLRALPQYREREATYKEVPLGLLLYPVLQAADVLAQRGTLVPTGRDQRQHLQLAAHLARAFAYRYGHAFPEPKALLPDDGSDRILSLRDPAKKMSKSDPDSKSRILMTDSDDVIELKIRKAVTDCNPQVTYEPESRPGVSNLVALHCLAADKVPEEVVEEADGLTTAQYKRVVARALCEHVAPIRERAHALVARPQFLKDVLRHGASRARARADVTYEHAARLMGIAAGGG